MHAEPVDLPQSNCISFAKTNDDIIDGWEQYISCIARKAKACYCNAGSSGTYHPVHCNPSYSNVAVELTTQYIAILVTPSKLLLNMYGNKMQDPWQK